MTAPIPPLLRGIIEDLEALAEAETKFAADARLIAAERLRLMDQAMNQAAIYCEQWRHRGAADGYSRAAKLCREAAERLTAQVPVRTVEARAP